VDPLDGTREFGEPGRSDWAVHVALWARGELTAGAVALPARDRVLGTADPVRVGPDASLNRRLEAATARIRHLESDNQQLRDAVPPASSGPPQATATRPALGNPEQHATFAGRRRTPRRQHCPPRKTAGQQHDHLLGSR
jgi:3'(2'), 5'-bisphosphate nucleotidase